MITYKRCSEVNIDDVFEAFSLGFSDYIIKMNIPKDFFIKRFFGVEGNSIEHSFVAFENSRPIGVVLGGIKNYEGIKTIRCGALAVIPDYRGMGVSQKLMELHKNEALGHGCRQMFLEVIAGNDRAINFYNKFGYEKIYDLYYYTLEDASKLKSRNKLNMEIKNIETAELGTLREKAGEVHINWQNDMEYIEMSEGQITLGAFIDNKLAGAVSVNRNTRINFIYVEKAFRNNGIAAGLVVKSAQELQLSKITAGVPNNAVIQGFLKHTGFTKDKLSQYEMYYSL